MNQQLKKDKDLIKQYESDLNMQKNQNHIKLAYQVLPWLKNEKWDEIIISKAGNNHKVKVENPILKNLSILNFGKEINEKLFLSDVEPYKYTLVSGKERHDIVVVSRDVVKIEGHYFNSSPYTYKLGDAFFEREKYQVAGNILTKIENSGMVTSSEFNYPTFDSFRIQKFAHILSKEGILLSKKPNINTNPIMNFTFYYFGEKIILYVYDDNLKIRDRNNDYWYQLKNARYQLPGILSAN